MKPSRRFDVPVSIALILTVLLQSAAVLLWVGAAAERISQLEKRTANQAAITERLARLEEQVSQARATLDRIEQRLNP